MKTWMMIALGALFFCSRSSLLQAEIARLASGKEIEIIDGGVPDKIAEEVFHDALGLLKKGKLELASDYCRLLIDKGRGEIVFRARATREQISQIERGSFIVLRSGSVLKGKIKANLRTDLLGLEGKDDIALWQIKEITAEYHTGYSRVSKTFYPLTLLEIVFRDGEIKSSRVTGEIEISLEADEGKMTGAVLGKDYEILRPDNLDRQIEAIARERVIKIVVYPDLKSYR